MLINKSNKITYYTSEKLNNIGFIRHFFSTRIGGVSTGYYDSLNLGVYTNDSSECLSENMNKIFNAVGIDKNRCVYLKQIHSNKFKFITDKNYMNCKGEDGDALITSQKFISIGVFTADCVPILLVDKNKSIISAVHAGWKGTKDRIVQEVLCFMKNTLGSNCNDIYAAIGPSIGPCCFEVGEDVAQNFTFKTTSKDKYYVNLWEENKKQMLEFGILKDNIDMACLCTSCNENLFYSYRRDEGQTGRMAAFIQII